MLWASILSYLFMFFGNCWWSGHFWRIVFPCWGELKKQGCGVTKITQNFDKKLSCLWTCFGTHFFLKKDASMDQHEWFSIGFGVRQGSPQGVQRTMFSGSENTLGTKWLQEPPKGPPRLPKAPKITRKHRFSSIFACVLTSFVILFCCVLYPFVMLLFNPPHKKMR